MSPSWVSSQKSQIWIFNVERGLSVFIRTALNQGIMYDFGCSEDFKPSEFLSEQIIPYLDKHEKHNLAQTIISHPHSDHISDIYCLLGSDGEKSVFNAQLHTCPHHKTGSEKPEAINWNRIVNPEGHEDKIDIYKSLYEYEKRKLPLQTICYDSTISIPNLEYGLFYVRPPIVEGIFQSDDQEYGNGISLVLFYRHGLHTILIPGDINPACLKHILDEEEGLEKRYSIFDRRESEIHPEWHLRTLDQPSLRYLVGTHGLSILLAPHHGLESGFSEDLFKSIKDKKPGLIAISEKRHLTDKNGEVCTFYQSADGAKGQVVCIEGKEEKRFSVSTRNNHNILILFQGTGGNPEVFLEKEPEKLLDRL